MTRPWLPWAASIPTMPLLGYCIWLFALPEYKESFGFACVVVLSVVLAIVTFLFIAMALYDEERGK